MDELRRTVEQIKQGERLWRLRGMSSRRMPGVWRKLASPCYCWPRHVSTSRPSPAAPYFLSTSVISRQFSDLLERKVAPPHKLRSPSPRPRPMKTSKTSGASFFLVSALVWVNRTRFTSQGISSSHQDGGPRADFRPVVSLRSITGEFLSPLPRSIGVRGHVRNCGQPAQIFEMSRSDSRDSAASVASREKTRGARIQFCLAGGSFLWQCVKRRFIRPGNGRCL